MRKPVLTEVNIFSLEVGNTFMKINSATKSIYKVKGKNAEAVFYELAGNTYVTEKDTKVLIYK